MRQVVKYSTQLHLAIIERCYLFVDEVGFIPVFVYQPQYLFDFLGGVCPRAPYTSDGLDFIVAQLVYLYIFAECYKPYFAELG